MSSPTSSEFFDQLQKSLERLPRAGDNEAWRREALVRRILTSGYGLGYLQHEVRSEVPVAFNAAEIARVRANLQRYDGTGNQSRPRRLASRRLRLDFLVVPDRPDATKAIVEAKRKASKMPELLDNEPQLLEQQLLMGVEVGALTDGEAWALFQRGELVLVIDSFEDLRRRLPDLRYLLGRESLTHGTHLGVTVFDSVLTAPTERL